MPLEGTVAVTLNHRTPRETARAVESLRQGSPSLAGIIVVDNASGDDSVSLLRDLPDVRLIVADRNGGFSAGCNLGIREALRLGAKRVFLLNSDALVSPDTVTLLAEALAADARFGIAGPIILEGSQPESVQSLGIRYSRTTGRMRHLGHGEPRVGGPRDARVVDGVSGCAMLIRQEVFAAVGLLAEEYFFGFEDLDFCLRAQAAGFATVCVGAATAWHEGSVSIGRRSALRAYFATRNHLLLASRASAHRSRAARGMLAATVATLNLAHVLVAAEVPRLEGLRGFARGLQDHLAGRYGPASLQTGSAANIRSPLV